MGPCQTCSPYTSRKLSTRRLMPNPSLWGSSGRRSAPSSSPLRRKGEKGRLSVAHRCCQSPSATRRRAERRRDPRTRRLRGRASTKARAARPPGSETPGRAGGHRRATRPRGGWSADAPLQISKGGSFVGEVGEAYGERRAAVCRSCRDAARRAAAAAARAGAATARGAAARAGAAAARGAAVDDFDPPAARCWERERHDGDAGAEEGLREESRMMFIPEACGAMLRGESIFLLHDCERDVHDRRARGAAPPFLAWAKAGKRRALKRAAPRAGAQPASSHRTPRIVGAEDEPEPVVERCYLGEEGKERARREIALDEVGWEDGDACALERARGSSRCSRAARCARNEAITASGASRK